MQMYMQSIAFAVHSTPKHGFVYANVHVKTVHLLFSAKNNNQNACKAIIVRHFKGI